MVSEEFFKLRAKVAQSDFYQPLAVQVGTARELKLSSSTAIMRRTRSILHDGRICKTAGVAPLTCPISSQRVRIRLTFMEIRNRGKFSRINHLRVEKFCKRKAVILITT